MTRIVILFCMVMLLTVACSSQKSSPSADQASALIFKDNFNRSELGSQWLDTGGGYRIVNGELRAHGAKNKPLWLKQRLPRNAKIEFRARSESADIDIKAELYGDGKSKATAMSYSATSYVIILGGWRNTRSIIARMDEHGDDRQVREEPKGDRGKTYLFSITRLDDRVAWRLDGKPFLEMRDESPLEGAGHEFFAFNNWMSEVFFDDITIFKL